MRGEERKKGEEEETRGESREDYGTPVLSSRPPLPDRLVVAPTGRHDLQREHPPDLKQPPSALLSRARQLNPRPAADDERSRYRNASKQPTAAAAAERQRRWQWTGVVMRAADGCYAVGLSMHCVV